MARMPGGAARQGRHPRLNTQQAVTPKRELYYVEVVGRALDVLEVFVHERMPQLTLKEISARLRQNNNSVFRLLYTLAEHGYVLKIGKKYELGAKLFDLTNAKLRHSNLVAVAGPYLEALRQAFRETVNLGILAEGQIRYIDVHESFESFRLAERIGGTDLIHCTALGKAHLAYLSFAEVRGLIRTYGAPVRTPHTITSLSGLKAELETTRDRGYALDREESVLGAFCVAVPILDAQNHPLAAISISGPLVRFNDSHVPAAAKALLDTAAQVQAKLHVAARSDSSSSNRRST